MLACTTLRIDRDDGSAVADYRIEDDRVESRTLCTATEGGPDTENRWQQLTPGQLSSHVMRDTVVARWLHRRMGVHPLIRACSQHFSSANEAEQERSGKMAAPVTSTTGEQWSVAIHHLDFTRSLSPPL